MIVHCDGILYLEVESAANANGRLMLLSLLMNVRLLVPLSSDT